MISFSRVIEADALNTAAKSHVDWMFVSGILPIEF